MIQTGMSLQTLQAAQLADPVLQDIYHHLFQGKKPTAKQWKCPPLHRYQQLWPQLKVVDGVVCRKYCPGPLQESIATPVLPRTLQHDALVQVHDTPAAGHQGQEKTLHQLHHDAYWPGVASDINKHCQQCITCQQSKLPAPTRAPLISLPVGKPWEMIAVDVLEVPISFNGNRYLLVEDYFTKWADAFPIPDQTAKRITKELIGLCSRMGLPIVLHSDQGRNFESTILKQTLDAFRVTKSHTTAYHPLGDGKGMVRSLLQMLHLYVEQEADWECYLPLVMLAYRTTVHSSTKVSPFMLMFGRQASFNNFSAKDAFDPNSYEAQLRHKMASLQDMVEANFVEAASFQRVACDKHSVYQQFKVNDPVWLSNPRRGKLDPRWEGGWTVSNVKGESTVEICKGNTRKVVHVNHLRYHMGSQETAVPIEAQKQREYCGNHQQLITL